MKKKVSAQKDDTALTKRVIRWLNEHGQGYDDGAKGAYRDLMQGGCQSGMVGELIYYRDTLKFYKTYKKDIHALLKESLDSTGVPLTELFGDKWDADDPLADDTSNQNLLAWFGFEEAARIVADREGWND